MNTKLFRRLVLPSSVDVNEVLDFDGLPIEKLRLTYCNKSSSSSSASKVILYGVLENNDKVMLGVVGNQYVNQIEIEFSKIENALPSRFMLSVIHGSSSSEQEVVVSVLKYDSSAQGSAEYFINNTSDIVPIEPLNED